MYIYKNNFYGGDDPEIIAQCTDEIPNETVYLYWKDNSTWKIENGKFIKLKTEAEMRELVLNRRYIPSESKSAMALLRSMLQATPLSDDDEKIAASGLYEPWTQGKYAVGDIRNNAGQTWECHTTHDNAEYPDITPSNPQTWANFWRPLHGKSAATARPWLKPQYGTTDMYHAGEYMVYTDGKVYRCLSDTVYSPEEYAAAWEMQA